MERSCEPSQFADIWEDLRIDEQNVEENRERLSQQDLLKYLECLPSIFGLVEEYITTTGRDRPGSETIGDSNFLLRFVLLQSSRCQFLRAVGHLMRGHFSEMWAHLRTMAENAGVARKTHEDKDLGKVFFSDQERDWKEYRKRVHPRNKIFRKGDKFAEAVESFYEMANQRTHANFVAFGTRIGVDFSELTGANKVRIEVHCHDGATDYAGTVGFHGFLLAVTTVLTLLWYLSVFDLPDSHENWATIRLIFSMLCDKKTLLETSENIESFNKLEDFVEQLFPTGS